jgi:cell division protein FtsW
MKKHKVKKPSFYYDPTLLVVVICLLSFGLLMVGSASMVISDKQYGYSFHYIIRQVIFVVLGISGGWLATRVPLRVWEKSSRNLFIVSLVFLMLVLIPGIGLKINGSRRWLNLGFISLQVSEFVKLTSILYLSSYLSRYSVLIKESLATFMKPIAVLTVLGFLLLMEPDFGALTVIAIVFISLLFITGARLLPFFVMLVSVLCVMAALAILAPYRFLRLTTFLHPWSHAYGSGYQLTQSLIAFGRGGWFGVGLGNSIQKLHYLPEAHSDFIFAVIAEELGFVGELLLVLLIAFFVYRLFVLAKRSDQRGLLYPKYVCYGLGLWVSVQSFINIGVTAGILPTKGLTLPFVSYGGSSMLVSCVSVGIVLRVAYELSFSDTGHANSVARYRR